MISGYAHSALRMLISIGATAPVQIPEPRLAQALADCGQRLPGTAAAAVAYFNAQRENLAPLAHHAFFVNLAWRPDGSVATWETASRVAEDAATEALALNNAELYRFEVASTVLWRHLVAAADGLALSSRIPPGMFPALDASRGCEGPRGG
ncbi:MAG TPA: hypothetical protein VGF17_04350 [Phytomonospora sp.]